MLFVVIIKAAISDFSQLTAQVIFTTLDALPCMDFRHIQCASMLYEVVCVNTGESDTYDEPFKLHGLAAFLKAFPEQQDLERYLCLRTNYFPLLLRHIERIVFADPDDGDDADESADAARQFARKVLVLAHDLANNVKTNIQALEQYCHLDTTPHCRDFASSGVQQAWCAVVQRAAEAVSGSPAVARTESQWHQLEHTYFMRTRSSKIDDLRHLFKETSDSDASASAPTPVVGANGKKTPLSKDVMARYIAQQQVAGENAKESNILNQQAIIASSKDAMTAELGLTLQHIKSDDAAGSGSGGSTDELVAGFIPLASAMSRACMAGHLTQEQQATILDACQVLTSHVMGKADVGIKHLVINAGQQPDKIKGLRAVPPQAPSDADASQPLPTPEIRLFLRGTIVPAAHSNAASKTDIVFTDVASITCIGQVVRCNLVVKREQMNMLPWTGRQTFCPALLVKQAKAAKDADSPNSKKGKGKGTAKKDTDDATLTLTLDETSEDVVVGETTITLKIMSLYGVLVADAFLFAETVNLSGPSLKRRAPDADEINSAKRMKAATALLAGSGTAPAAPSSPLDESGDKQ